MRDGNPNSKDVNIICNRDRSNSHSQSPKPKKNTAYFASSSSLCNHRFNMKSSSEFFTNSPIKSLNIVDDGSALHNPVNLFDDMSMLTPSTKPFLEMSTSTVVKDMKRIYNIISYHPKVPRMKKVTMLRLILSVKSMNVSVYKVGYECWGEIMSPLNDKLMKKSHNMMSKINSNVNLKKKVYEVDVTYFTF